jgi:hypothetical protein
MGAGRFMINAAVDGLAYGGPDSASKRRVRPVKPIGGSP